MKNKFLKNKKTTSSLCTNELTCQIWWRSKDIKTEKIGDDKLDRQTYRQTFFHWVNLGPIGLKRTQIFFRSIKENHRRKQCAIIHPLGFGRIKKNTWYLIILAAWKKNTWKTEAEKMRRSNSSLKQLLSLSHNIMSNNR